MNRRKLALQSVTLIVAYALACSDPRELRLHPRSSPARLLSANPGAGAPAAPRGALSREQITTVLRSVAPSLSGNCWQQHRVTTQHVSIRLDIAAAGDVRELQIEQAPTHLPGLGECVALGLKPVQFPDGASGSRVTASLAFSDSAPAVLELWSGP